MALPPPFANFVVPDGPTDTFLASANVTQYSRVQLLSTGSIQAATNATDLSFGVAIQTIYNTAYGVVRLDYHEGIGLANTNINVGDTLYLANTGYVSSSSVNNCQVGVARTAAITPAANSSNQTQPVVYVRVTKSA